MSTRQAKMGPADIEAAKRLRAIWDERAKGLGLTQESAGAALGFTQGAASHYLNARIPLALEVTLKWAALLGCKAGDIRPEFADHTTPTTTAPFLRPISVWEDAADLPPDQYVFFPKLEHRWSCGSGGPDHSQIEQTDKTIPFTADWAKRMGWSPRTHFTMRAAGESMEPTIQDKAPVVIDTSEAGRNVRSGKVYAITVNGEPLLKRLDKLPGGRLRVRSDNQAPAYAAFEVADGDIEIIGRAVWTPVQL